MEPYPHGASGGLAGRRGTVDPLLINTTTPLCMIKSTMNRRLLPLLLGALLAAGCAQDATVPIDQIQAPVVYTNHPNAGFSATANEQELFLVDAASGQTWRLTSNGVRDEQPVWSPDGTQLLFLSTRPVLGRTGGDALQLFRYDLGTGRVAHVDLDWAYYGSGPASPELPEDNMRILGWLECVAWSPVDPTQVAIGVTVDTKMSDPPNIRVRRLVLLDLEERTSRLIAPYKRNCNSLFWAPDGRYLAIADNNDFHYVDAETGEKHAITGDHVVNGDTVTGYSPVDWTASGDQLLVKGRAVVIRERELLRISDSVYYTYNVRDHTWSERLATMPHNHFAVGFAPASSQPTPGDSLRFIVQREEEGSFHSDLWLYGASGATEIRLTDDQMPKRDARPYHAPVP